MERDEIKSGDCERRERNERKSDDCEWKGMRGRAMKVIRKIRGGQRHSEWELFMSIVTHSLRCTDKTITY